MRVHDSNFLYIYIGIRLFGLPHGLCMVSHKINHTYCDDQTFPILLSTQCQFTTGDEETIWYTVGRTNGNAPLPRVFGSFIGRRNHPHPIDFLVLARAVPIRRRDCNAPREEMARTIGPCTAEVPLCRASSSARTNLSWTHCIQGK